MPSSYYTTNVTFLVPKGSIAVTIYGLANHTTYTAYVAAYSEAGIGLAVSSTITTPEAGTSHTICTYISNLPNNMPECYRKLTLQSNITLRYMHNFNVHSSITNVKFHSCDKPICTWNIEQNLLLGLKKSYLYHRCMYTPQLYSATLKQKHTRSMHSTN